LILPHVTICFTRTAKRELSVVIIIVSACNVNSNLVAKEPQSGGIQLSQSQQNAALNDVLLENMVLQHCNRDPVLGGVPAPLLLARIVVLNHLFLNKECTRVVPTWDSVTGLTHGIHSGLNQTLNPLGQKSHMLMGMWTTPCTDKVLSNLSPCSGHAIATE